MCWLNDGAQGRNNAAGEVGPPRSPTGILLIGYYGNGAQGRNNGAAEVTDRNFIDWVLR